jgi:hypothetical protein
LIAHYIRGSLRYDDTIGIEGYGKEELNIKRE